jgi:hypothetical protein
MIAASPIPDGTAVLEYAFFDPALVQRFVDFAANRGIACQVEADAVAGSVVAVPDDLPDPLVDALDDCYETLQQEQAESAQAQEGWVTKRLAGIQVTRADGSLFTVRLDADTANLLLGAFAPADAQALVQAIVNSLDNPVEGPLCRNPAE